MKMSRFCSKLQNVIWTSHIFQKPHFHLTNIRNSWCFFSNFFFEKKQIIRITRTICQSGCDRDRHIERGRRKRERHTNLWQQQAIFVHFSDSSYCSATWDMVARFVLFNMDVYMDVSVYMYKWCFIDSVWLSLDLLFSLIHNKNPLFSWLIVFIEFYSLMLLENHIYLSKYMCVCLCVYGSNDVIMATQQNEVKRKKAARNRCNMIHYLIFKAISFSDTTHCRIMHTKILQSRQSLAIFCTNTMVFCWLSEKSNRMDFWCQHFSVWTIYI